MKLILSLLAAFVTIAFAAPTRAESVSGVMRVGARVTESCAVAASPMLFELDNAPGSGASATSTLDLSCNRGVRYAVGLDRGGNASGPQRAMIDAATGARLDYAIFADAARTRAWGDGTRDAAVTGVVDGDGRASLTAYGLVPAAAEARAPGEYADTVTITVTF